MGKIVKIGLENIRFYSYHGFYPEEQLLGNEYYLSIKTSFHASLSGEIDLNDTVNYERLYAMASESMNEPRKLLETVANEILEKIKAEFNYLAAIEVSIQKINPPFGGDTAEANVSLLWHSNP